MPFRHICLPLIVLVGWVAGATSVRAEAGSVELNLVGDSQGAALAFQAWSQALAKAGIRNVNLSTSPSTPTLRIDVRGTKERPVYVVTGAVTSRDELVLPGGKFRRSEVGRLAEWIKDLAEQGPPDQREKKVAFGLPASRFQQARDELAKPVGFATQGMARDKVVEGIAQRLKSPPRIDAEASRTLSGDTVAENLADISSGTALAYVLRPAGYCLTLRDSKGAIAYSIVKAQSDVESWPVGAVSDKTANELSPALFEFHNVNVQDVSAADALKAIAERVKLPVLIDHKALAWHKIDPAKVNVSLPQARTTYGLALRRLLFEARLKFDVRCDEAGAPFLWVTTIKPL